MRYKGAQIPEPRTPDTSTSLATKASCRFRVEGSGFSLRVEG